jgi:hypothetical protein
MNSETFFVMEVCKSSQHHCLQGLKPSHIKALMAGLKSRPCKNWRCHAVSRAMPSGGCRFG